MATYLPLYEVSNDSYQGIEHRSHKLPILYFVLVINVFFLGWLTLVYDNVQHIPIAAENPSFVITIGNYSYSDDYAWMDPLKHPQYTKDTFRYIRQENEYSDRYFKSIHALIQNISIEYDNGFDLTSSANQECLPMNDSFIIGSFVYWKSNDHQIYRGKRTNDACECKLFVSANTPIESVLDYRPFINNSYLNPGLFEVHPLKEHLLAFSFDNDGSENMQLHFKNLTSNAFISKNGEPILKNSYYSGRWMTFVDKSTFFYVNVVSKEFGTPMNIYRICIENCPDKSFLTLESVHALADPQFTVEVSTSFEFEFLFFNIIGQTKSQHIILSSNETALSSSRLSPALFYDSNSTYYETKSTIDYRNGRFVVLSNAMNNHNRFIISFSYDDYINHILPGQVSFSDMIVRYGRVEYAHLDNEFIESFFLHQEFILLWFRKSSFRSFKLLRYNHTEFTTFYTHTTSKMPYALVPDYPSDLNSSSIQPMSSYSVDTTTLKLSMINEVKLKDQERDCFWSMTLWAPSRRDASITIPLSISQKRKECLNPQKQVFQKLDKVRPVYMKAYGAYGGFQDPEFNDEQLILLERGFIVSTCHPRGDGDLGAFWYRQGKYEYKNNTMLDVVDCMRYLVEQGYTRPGWIAFKGRSAGGLVAATLLNEYGYVENPHQKSVPMKRSLQMEKSLLDAQMISSIEADAGANNLVGVIVAQVPFVDVIYDMMNDKIPWTAFEYSEWGNPANKTLLDAMRGYSPYHHMKSQAFPSILVTGGLTDPRVPFWEPVKWMARIRKCKVNNVQDSVSASETRKDGVANTFALLSMSEFGHFSSGETEMARMYAFIIDSMQRIVNSKAQM